MAMAVAAGSVMAGDAGLLLVSVLASQ